MRMTCSFNFWAVVIIYRLGIFVLCLILSLFRSTIHLKHILPHCQYGMEKKITSMNWPIMSKQKISDSLTITLKKCSSGASPVRWMTSISINMLLSLLEAGKTQGKVHFAGAYAQQNWAIIFLKPFPTIRMGSFLCVRIFWSTWTSYPPYPNSS